MFRQLYRHPKLTEWALRSRRGWPRDIVRKAFRETGSLIIGREVPGHHEQLFEQREIRIGDKQVPAVETETDGLFEPPTYCARLERSLSKRYCKKIFHAEVTEIERKGVDWIVRASGKEFEAKVIVNAAGAWLNQFMVGDCADARVEAKAYARHLAEVSGLEEIATAFGPYGYVWDETTHWYTRNWSSSNQLASICDKEAANPDLVLQDETVPSRVMERLQNMLGESCVRGEVRNYWHCFRTYTEDALPIVGEDPTHEGLFWLAAFGGFGMSTSFAAAEDAARYICGDSVSIEPDFLPIRVKYESPLQVAES